MELNQTGPPCVRCPPGTVLGPLLYSLHIYDIMLDIQSKTRCFADDCLCYPEIKYMEVTLKLQKMQHVAADKTHKKSSLPIHTLGSTVHEHVKASNISV